MSQAVICPVCKGEGERLRRPVSHGDKLVQCWGCHGKGWVEIDSDPPAPTIVAYTGDYNEAK